MEVILHNYQFPQICMICLCNFLHVMINDMFQEVGAGFGLSLFADDGAIWKRGRNIAFLTEKVQGALDKVVDWAGRWGLKCQWNNPSVLFFPIGNTGATELRLYGQELERVKEFRFLGVTFDERVTWRSHIAKTVQKCEKII